MLGSTVFRFTVSATTAIYTLSLHDALPISPAARPGGFGRGGQELGQAVGHFGRGLEAAGRVLLQKLHDDRLQDRKSTRLNSSHLVISYAVFCLKKKNKTKSLTHA